jgi:GWxTD domain-containing protein
MRKNKAMRFLLFSLGAFALSAAAPTAQADDELSPAHRRWLQEEVVYIITDAEKDAFLKLSSDELRDKFIEIFWEKRDPTPGTMRNEFKEEHYRRVEYANKNFGPRGMNTGWRTERGRVYIMLGEPKERKEYANNEVVYPLEIWFYSADGRIPGVSFFYMMFFKRGGAGDYEIYHPFVDGPEALASGFGRSTQEVLTYLEIIDAEVARASISLNPMDPGGTLSSEVLLGKIDNYPETAMDGSWATNFLDSEGRVDVTYLFKPMSVSSIDLVFVPPDGRQELHYGFMLKPEDIEIGQYEADHYAAFEITPTLSTQDGSIIFEKPFTAEFGWAKEEFQLHKSTPLLFADLVPVIPGEYTFTVRVRNKVSRTYFLITNSIYVPDRNEDRFALSNLLLNYDYERAEPAPGQSEPFRFFNVRYKPSSTNEFAEFENVHVFFQLFYPAPEGEESPVGDIKFEFNIYRDEELVKQLDHIVTHDRLNPMGIIYMSRQLPLMGLGDGDYRLEVKTYDNKGGYATARSTLFSIKNPDLILRPTILTLHQKLYLGSPDWLLIRAGELIETGRTEKGIEELRAILEQNPEHMEAALRLCDLLMENKQFDEAYERARRIERVEPNNRKLVLILARASVGRGNASRAIGYYERLLFLNQKDVEVLNEVADIYISNGQPDKAKERLQTSLEAKPDQPEIRKKLENISPQ